MSDDGGRGTAGVEVRTGSSASGDAEDPDAGRAGRPEQIDALNTRVTTLLGTINGITQQREPTDGDARADQHRHRPTQTQITS